ncbi:MAG: DNA recombination/repair protein RecA, partial [Pseudomonadota bacterium]
EKAGSWYSYNGDRIGQGKENVRNFLLQNPEIAEDLNAKLRAILLPGPEVEASEDLKEA